MMSASNIRLSLQGFNMPNTQFDMFPSQNDNSSLPEIVEINTQASNVVDNMDSPRDHQIEYMQEEVETYDRETNSDDNVRRSLLLYMLGRLGLRFLLDIEPDK